MINFESDETQQERDIDQCTQKITEHFRTAGTLLLHSPSPSAHSHMIDTEALLKKFGKQGDEGGLTGPELVVRNNMQRSMAKKLQGLSTSFRSSQKEYMERLKAQKSGAAVGTFNYLENDSKKPNLADLDTGFTQTQMMELENMDAVCVPPTISHALLCSDGVPVL